MTKELDFHPDEPTFLRIDFQIVSANSFKDKSQDARGVLQETTKIRYYHPDEAPKFSTLLRQDHFGPDVGKLAGFQLLVSAFVAP